MSTSNGVEMKLLIGSGTSGDVSGPDGIFDFDSKTGFEAVDPYNVTFEFSVEIGGEGRGGYDWFSVVVSTNTGVSKAEKKVIFLEYYTYSIFRDRIIEIVRECEAVNWYECLVNLRRYFHWEYDGMYGEDELRRLNS
ncbi:hypothetical protein N185_15945 [Sinorhizobium sp. GW3]|nr:hypothetical protein N185_15945 [Sinorhizobium sp. GW3]